MAGTEYNVALREQISGPADKAAAAVAKLRAQVKGLQGDLAKVRGSLGGLPGIGGGAGSAGGAARVRGDAGRRIADEWQRMAAAAEKAAAREQRAVERAARQEQRIRERASAAHMRQTERDAARRERIRERENAAILRDVAREERARARAAASHQRQLSQASSARRGLGLDALQGVLGMLGGGIKGGIAATYAGTAYIGKELFQSARFKESAQRRLTATLGNPAEAADELRTAYKFAEKTEFDPESIVAAVAQLSNNFKDKKSRRYVLGSVADFASLTGTGTEGLERSIRAINQISGKGKLQQEELTGQLGELGLNTGQVYEQLAPMLGIKDKDAQARRDKVIKAITGGKVSGDMGVQAITNVMRNMAGGGAAGSYAGQNADSISGQVSNIQGGFATLFGLADVGEWDALKGVKGILADVAEIFNSDSKAGQGMTATIRGITDAFMPLVKEIKGDVADFKGGLEQADGSQSLFAKGLATVALRVYQVGKGLAYVVKWFFELYGAAVRADEILGEWADSAYNFAANFVEGLINGIKRGVVRVYDAAKELASGAKQGIEDFLDISSPSRVAAKLGGYTAEGFARGLTQGMQELEVPQLRLGGLQGGPGLGSGVIINNVFNLAAAPGATPQEFSRMVASEVRRANDSYFGQLVQEGA